MWSIEDTLPEEAPTPRPSEDNPFWWLPVNPSRLAAAHNSPTPPPKTRSRTRRSVTASSSKRATTPISVASDSGDVQFVDAIIVNPPPNSGNRSSARAKGKRKAPSPEISTSQLPLLLLLLLLN